MKKLKDLFRMLIKPEEKSLKIKSLRAAFWSMLGRGGSRGLRLASSLVLTRILFPEAFGLMATSNVILAMMQLFADTGVRISVIQNPKGAEPHFLNSAWVISIGRGVLLSVLVAALAWPLAGFYGKPELKGLLLLMALNPLIGGFENPALALVIKKFRVEKQVAYELSTHLLSVITSIILAWVLKSVYALAIGAVSLVIYRAIASYLVEPYRPRWEWDREAGSELVRFGKFIFMNTMFTWAVGNADMLLIGRMLDMDLLGSYNLGHNIGIAIYSFCLLFFTQSYLPAISVVSHDLSRVMRIYQRASSLVLAAVVPISVGVALFARDIITLLYDPRYQQASVALFWVSLAGMVRIIGLTVSNTFIGLGRPAYETMAMAIGLVFVGSFIPLGVVYGGFSGAGAGMCLSMTLITFLESIVLASRLGFSLRIVARPWAQVLLVTLSMGGIYLALRPWLDAERYHNLPFLMVMITIGLILSSGLYVLIEGRHPFKDQGGATRPAMLQK